MSSTVSSEKFVCSVPNTNYDRVVLGHGSGGTLTADLIQHLFLPAFQNPVLAEMEDQAVVRLEEGNPSPRIAITTDSYVVRPLFFPGGDIGQLAVYGTVNDLAVGGARPLFLTAAFILEEGLLLEDLQRIVHSMREACRTVGIQLVTGDTKVVDRGKGDKAFITTTGVGIVPEDCQLSMNQAQPGDRILVSGTIGDHGMAITSVREGLEFETELKSDVAPLHELTQVMLSACPSLRWMRDPTRGGVASVLNELVEGRSIGAQLDESSLPIRPEVQAACEMLGLDPLYVANEGKLIAIVSAEESDSLLKVLRAHPLGENAACIGNIVADRPGLVTLRSTLGGERMVTRLMGEQLPRIC